MHERKLAMKTTPFPYPHNDKREQLRLQKLKEQLLCEKSERQKIREQRKARRALGWKLQRLQPDTSPKSQNDFTAIQYIAMGLNYEAVARTTGLTYVRVEELARNRKGQKMIREHAEVFQQSIQEQIAAFAPIAEKFLEDLIKGDIPNASVYLRAKYANLALARAGHGEIRNVNIVHAQLTREDIERIKERAQKAAIDQGIIDGEFKELTD